MGLFSGVSNFLSSTTAMVTNVVKKTVDDAVEFVEDAVENTGEFLEDAGEVVGDAWESGTELVGGAAGAVGDYFSNMSILEGAALGISVAGGLAAFIPIVGDAVEIGAEVVATGLMVADKWGDEEAMMAELAAGGAAIAIALVPGNVASVGKYGAKAAIKEAVGQVAKKAIKEGAEQIASEVAEIAAKKAAKEGLEVATKQMRKEAMEEITQRIEREAVERLQREASGELTEQAGREMLSAAEKRARDRLLRDGVPADEVGEILMRDRFIRNIKGGFAYGLTQTLASVGAGVGTILLQDAEKKARWQEEGIAYDELEEMVKKGINEQNEPINGVDAWDTMTDLQHRMIMQGAIMNMNENGIKVIDEQGAEVKAGSILEGVDVKLSDVEKFAKKMVESAEFETGEKLTWEEMTEEQKAVIIAQSMSGLNDQGARVVDDQGNEVTVANILERGGANVLTMEDIDLQIREQLIEKGFDINTDVTERQMDLIRFKMLENISRKGGIVVNVAGNLLTEVAFAREKGIGIDPLAAIGEDLNRGGVAQTEAPSTPVIPGRQEDSPEIHTH